MNPTDASSPPVLKIDVSDADDQGRLRADGGSASDRANRMIIAKTALAAALPDTPDFDAMAQEALAALKALEHPHADAVHAQERIRPLTTLEN